MRSIPLLSLSPWLECLSWAAYVLPIPPIITYRYIHQYILLQRPNYLLNGKSAGREPIDPFPIRYCATLPDPTAKI